MLRSVQELKGCTIRSSDGDIGSVEQLYFDDEAWGVRYLVVDTGGWLTGHDVLISPMSIQRVDITQRAIDIPLTREQIKNSPPIDTHKPVSRQHEADYLGYYGYPAYWGGPMLWGLGAFPYPAERELAPAAALNPDLAEADEAQNEEDSHLRSTDEVTGYDIQATDDSIGEVDDFLFDDEAWAIRYIVIDTSSWWTGGKKVLISTRWIEGIDWPDRKVRVQLTRDEVQRSPEYDAAQPLDRTYEGLLHEHYRRPGYWD